MKTGAEIRQMFIDFFKEKGHTHVPSSSLVPAGDPTLLFTNAGMNQFKDVFLGLEKRPYTRAVTAQKCVRAGGKHNDLDAVGRTARHHTFFEMLGNFSFGDYFKKEALEWAWELVTSPRWFGLPKEKLWVTIYKDDEEAHDIWRAIGLPEERIVRMGEKDNFWAMGDTGPCGPCSEIFIDMGEEHRCDAEVCSIATCGCDRWREFWNNVFMQYNRQPDGTLVPLERPGVDTGLGLERMATILQGVWSNYDTDLLRDVIRAVEDLSGVRYDPGEGGLAHRVIADHVRACTFLIADGVRFSNEGRGYVMRRILRRAVRFGRTIGFKEPFMWKVSRAVVDLMGDAYPELRQNQEVIERELRRDEERFFATLDRGMERLEEIIAHMRRDGKTVIDGEDAFVLYDTYGFPLDIVQDVAREHGFKVDEEGYRRAMEAQRERARAARDVTYTGERLRGLAESLQDTPPTEFTGYTELAHEATVVAVLSPEGEPTGAGAGDRCIVVLDRTPFYAEGGGQVGDQGVMTAPGLRLRVEDTKKLPAGHHLHFVTVEEGFLEKGQRLTARVDAQRRLHTIKNHTATHLLHKALREVLGTHVHQAGSLVAPDRLRFDFTHEGPLTPEQVRAVEDRVNRVIEEGLPVEWTYMRLEEARASGAMALFGEKYGDIVRVVSVGDYSRELCGGTHCRNSSQIGLFKIVSESGVAAGVRRIEAVTGRRAYEYVLDLEDRLGQAALALKAPTLEEVPSRLESTLALLRALEREVEELRGRLARDEALRLLEDVREVDGVRFVAGVVAIAGMEDLRQMTDFLRQKLGSGVVVLGARSGDRANLVAAATADLAGKKVHCGNLVREVARLVDGSGGGRPDMAQAGGKSPEKLREAMDRVPEILRLQLRPAGVQG
ncbi:alanine--tRNA ligase [Caldinitratiruptor microaerophilus]|uniref:Alanine--tRNA ligase n=1 Tax=Caldinitratiruptor microaerophilus TaxID=671077 RepID=A0AA35CJS4_9FIRM|nr:alanine--tRNA ligase [Caldinitratiruptor microaerophilus]BDG59663.1 alanine--tRNA ligase [Caldinitratiruptor microaerophilus]